MLHAPVCFPLLLILQGIRCFTLSLPIRSQTPPPLNLGKSSFLMCSYAAISVVTRAFLIAARRSVYSDGSIAYRRCKCDIEHLEGPVGRSARLAMACGDWQAGPAPMMRSHYSPCIALWN